MHGAWRRLLGAAAVCSSRSARARCSGHGPAVRELPDAQWLPSLRRGRDEREQITDTVARLYTQGARIDWAKWAAPHARRRVPLPTYPFERKRYWVSPPASSTRPVTPARTLRAGDNPLLGAPLDVAVPTFETLLDVQQLAFQQDHRVGGRIVAPGALLLEMARAAGSQLLESPQVRVEDVRFREMLVVPEDDMQRAHLAFTETGDSTARWALFSRPASGTGEWIRHAEGRVTAERVSTGSSGTPLQDTRRNCRDSLSVESFYSQLATRGIAFGESFRGIRELWAGADAVIGRVQLPASIQHMGSTSAPYGAHPALLDATLQLVGVALMQAGHQETYMQVSLGRLSLKNPVPLEVWGVATLRARSRRRSKRRCTALAMARSSARSRTSVLRASLRSGSLLATMSMRIGCTKCAGKTQARQRLRRHRRAWMRWPANCERHCRRSLSSAASMLTITFHRASRVPRLRSSRMPCAPWVYACRW